MINELINNKEKYLWSKTEDEEIEIKVGGHDAGKFYGSVRFQIEPDHILMFVDVSNGISSAISLPTKRIDNGTTEHKLLDNFFLELDAYLELESTKFNYSNNRITLLSNLFQLLPKYSSIL